MTSASRWSIFISRRIFSPFASKYSISCFNSLDMTTLFWVETSRKWTLNSKRLNKFKEIWARQMIIKKAAEILNLIRPSDFSDMFGPRVKDRRKMTKSPMALKRITAIRFLFFMTMARNRAFTSS